MNKVILCGRLTADPEIRYSEGADGRLTFANYTLAVDRMKKDEADFPRCVAIGKNGEFAEKYLRKGMKILVEGRIQTGSYEKDGKKVYTTDVLVDRHEFVESKGTSSGSNEKGPSNVSDFLANIPVEDDEIPFI